VVRCCGVIMVGVFMMVRDFNRKSYKLTNYYLLTMKHVLILLEDDEYQLATKNKGIKTWKEILMKGANNL